MDKFEIATARKVRPLTFLYDGHKTDYKNYDKRREAFKRIADELTAENPDFGPVTEDEVKNCWEQLREDYRKTQNWVASNPYGRAAITSARQEELLNVLDFLKPHSHSVHGYANV